MALVSIITPAYNSAKCIQEAIKSAISQTYEEWEMIIVDDCSKDNTAEIVLDYCQEDNRIKLTRLNRNVGAAEARNVAIKEAKGRYIAFLDSDDIWYSEKLERQLTFMQSNDYAFTFTAYDQIDESGKRRKNLIEVPSRINYNQYLKNTIIGCLTVIIDREKTGNFYMPLIKSSHDMALWLLIMKRGFWAYGLNEVLASYRLVSTSNTAKKWEAAQDVWKVYRKFEDINFIPSCYYFFNYAFNAIKKRL